jgi:hypothetical protein
MRDHEQLRSETDCLKVEIKEPKFVTTLREASIKGIEGFQEVAAGSFHGLATIIRASAQTA